MVAVADNSSVLENENTVGYVDGAETVGNDECGASSHQFAQRPLDHCLALGVERACRLVKDEDRCVLQKCSRDRDALPLTSG